MYVSVRFFFRLLFETLGRCFLLLLKWHLFHFLDFCKMPNGGGATHSKRERETHVCISNAQRAPRDLLANRQTPNSFETKKQRTEPTTLFKWREHTGGNIIKYYHHFESIFGRLFISCCVSFDCRLGHCFCLYFCTHTEVHVFGPSCEWNVMSFSCWLFWYFDHTHKYENYLLELNRPITTNRKKTATTWHVFNR